MILVVYLALFWKYSGARKSGQKMIGQFFGKVLQSFARYRGNFCIILTTLLLDLKTSTQYSIWQLSHIKMFHSWLKYQINQFDAKCNIDIWKFFNI